MNRLGYAQVHFPISESVMHSHSSRTCDVASEGHAESASAAEDVCEAASVAFLRFLQSRQSVRRFTEESVSARRLTHILETAARAPSAHNRQPWRFHVVTDRGQKDAVAKAMGDRLREDRLADGDDEAIVEADVSRSRSRLLGAPVLVFVFLTMEHMDIYPDARRQAAEYAMAVQSVAMATQNLLLGAHAEGLGACIMCAPLFCPTVVAQVLGAPASWIAQSIVALGKPAVIGQPKGRRPLRHLMLGDVAGCND
jgi:F420 biosynthesis protein FbiB-like protein